MIKETDLQKMISNQAQLEKLKTQQDDLLRKTQTHVVNEVKKILGILWDTEFVSLFCFLGTALELRVSFFPGSPGAFSYGGYKLERFDQTEFEGAAAFVLARGSEYLALVLERKKEADFAFEKQLNVLWDLGLKDD